MLLFLSILVAFAILERGKRFGVHTRRSGDCQCVSPRYCRRSMCSLLLSVLRVHTLVLVAVLVFLVSWNSIGVVLNYCSEGMMQGACFATDSAGKRMIVKTKGELQQHYQGMVYFQKWSTPAFKQLLPVMEKNWETCQKFHRDGNTQVVFFVPIGLQSDELVCCCMVPGTYSRLLQTRCRAKIVRLPLETYLGVVVHV